MPTQPYYLDGKRVPGVTTVLDKDIDGLLHWSWQAGRDGKDWKELRQAAADAGTACHAMAECDFHGRPFDRTPYPPDILEKADHAFQGFLKWKEQTKLRVIKSELALVSKLGFGGCMDAVAIDSCLYLMDYKTSNSLREDMLVQVGGGYALLWEEHYPDQPLDGMQILRFSKPHEPGDPVSFHVHHYSKDIFPIAQQEFLNRLASYRNRARLKKLI